MTSMSRPEGTSLSALTTTLTGLPAAAPRTSPVTSSLPTCLPSNQMMFGLGGRLVVRGRRRALDVERLRLREARSEHEEDQHDEDDVHHRRHVDARVTLAAIPVFKSHDQTSFHFS